MKTTWIGAGDTRILMGEIFEDREVPEWQPMGQVTRRKIYENMPIFWHAWKYLEHGKFLLGRFPDIMAATLAVEKAMSSPTADSEPRQTDI